MIYVSFCRPFHAWSCCLQLNENQQHFMKLPDCMVHWFGGHMADWTRSKNKLLAFVWILPWHVRQMLNWALEIFEDHEDPLTLLIANSGCFCLVDLRQSTSFSFEHNFLTCSNMQQLPLSCFNDYLGRYLDTKKLHVFIFKWQVFVYTCLLRLAFKLMMKWYFLTDKQL